MNRELEQIICEVEKAISGKRAVIEKILMAILSDGHILLDDVPGVGKTTLALALSRTLGLSYNRVQFTPDVLPSDIIGFSVYDKNTGSFTYKPGVVNDTNLLLGDEINRTSSKTQSALLEAMEERQVTVDAIRIRCRSRSSSSRRRTTSERPERSRCRTRRWTASSFACPSATPISTRRWNC